MYVFLTCLPYPAVPHLYPPLHCQVEAWLVRIKCGDHAGAFRAKFVDGMALSGMLR